MSKLFKLKEWLTIPEAAKYLSVVFDEEVTEADVLRLGLDRHLKLSVNFVNHTEARRGIIIAWDETEWLRTYPWNETNTAIIYADVTPENLQKLPPQFTVPLG